MSALVALVAFIAVILLVTGVQQYTIPGLGKRLVHRWTKDTGLKQQSRFDKHIRPTVKKLASRFDFLREVTKPEGLEEKLAYAGYPLDLDAYQFFGLRILVALAFFIGGIYYAVLGLCGWPIVLLGLPIAGFFVPLFWLQQRVKTRQDEITRTLPYMLDLLFVCVQAGMGFDQSLQHIVDNMSGPLQEEMEHFLREIRMGETRENAFQHLAERNSSEVLQVFGNAMIQAEELGTPISTILQIQADDMRARRRHRAREVAARASPRISLVVIFLIAPPALMLMIGALVLGAIFGSGLSLNTGVLP